MSNAIVLEGHVGPPNNVPATFDSFIDWWIARWPIIDFTVSEADDDHRDQLLNNRWARAWGAFVLAYDTALLRLFAGSMPSGAIPAEATKPWSNQLNAMQKHDWIVPNPRLWLEQRYINAASLGGWFYVLNKLHEQAEDEANKSSF